MLVASIVKFDAERHDLSVLHGTPELARENRPTTVIEDKSSEIEKFLSPVGNVTRKFTASSNQILRSTRKRGLFMFLRDMFRLVDRDLIDVLPLAHNRQLLDTNHRAL